jgi:HEAT repeat protein
MLLVSVSAMPAHSQSLEDDWFLAAQEGNTQKLVALLSEGVDVDMSGPNGETALMLAAGNGRTDSVRALLSAGAAVEAQAEGGLTALMVASAMGDVEIIRMLLDSGADARRRAANGAGPLFAAALGGPHIEAMRVLLSEGAELEELVLALTHQESALRVRAVMALALLGSDAKSAVPSLAEALGDKNLNVRYWAASALKKIGPEARAAVPYLVEALKTHPDRTPALEGPPRYYADVRWVAAEALGEIGLSTAVPALKVAVGDEHPQVRSAAVEALEKIEDRAR